MSASIHKQQIEQLKSREEFNFRVLASRWKSPEVDTDFRLAALTVFSPDRTDRQLFNQTKVSCFSTLLK